MLNSKSDEYSMHIPLYLHHIPLFDGWPSSHSKLLNLPESKVYEASAEVPPSCWRKMSSSRWNL
jgi:hypothetical protein